MLPLPFRLWTFATLADLHLSVHLKLESCMDVVQSSTAMSAQSATSSWSRAELNRKCLRNLLPRDLRTNPLLGRHARLGLWQLDQASLLTRTLHFNDL